MHSLRKSFFFFFLFTWTSRWSALSRKSYVHASEGGEFDLRRCSDFSRTTSLICGSDEVQSFSGISGSEYLVDSL
jgi:hypothetical protein